MAEEKRFRSKLGEGDDPNLKDLFEDCKFGLGMPGTEKEFPVLSGLVEDEELNSMEPFKDCKFGLDNPGEDKDFPVLSGLIESIGVFS